MLPLSACSHRALVVTAFVATVPSAPVGLCPATTLAAMAAAAASVLSSMRGLNDTFKAVRSGDMRWVRGAGVSPVSSVTR
jgi:hypothetical protein